MPYIGTCFRFYTQMRVQKKKNKSFAYRIYSHFSQQCPVGALSMVFVFNLHLLYFWPKLYNNIPQCLVSSSMLILHFNSSNACHFDKRIICFSLVLPLNCALILQIVRKVFEGYPTMHELHMPYIHPLHTYIVHTCIARLLMA